MSIRKWIAGLIKIESEARMDDRSPQDWLNQAVAWEPPASVTEGEFRAAVEPWMQRVPELRAYEEMILAAKWLRSIACQSADAGHGALARAICPTRRQAYPR